MHHTPTETTATYTVTITVTDDDNDDTSDTFTVNNVTPSIEAGPSHVIDESGPVTINPTFSDPGFTVPSVLTAETFTAIIDWGEGTVESRIVTVVQGGEDVLTTGGFSGSFTYGDNGVYTVTVPVTDGADISDTLTVTVNNVTPALDSRLPFERTVLNSPPTRCCRLRTP